MPDLRYQFPNDRSNDSDNISQIRFNSLVKEARLPYGLHASMLDELGALIDLKITLKARNQAYGLPYHRRSIVHASSIDSTADLNLVYFP